MVKKTYNFSEIYCITDFVLNSLRNSVIYEGFKEILPCIISKRYEPGARHSVVVLGNQNVPTVIKNNENVTVNGKEAFYIPVSNVVDKQMSAEHLKKVFCVAPCLRLVMDGEEKSGKHLYNFFQFAIEWRTESMEDVFLIGNKILNKTAERLLNNAEFMSILKKNNKTSKNLESLSVKNFPVVSFREAQKIIGKSTEINSDFTPEEDNILSRKFSSPFWIFDYPPGVRDSIYHENSRGFFDTYDLILPFGFGELTTGGIRPKSKEEIIQQSLALGKSYHPAYADWKDKSKIQTAGFSIGLERLMRFVTDAETILNFVQYHDDGPNKNIIENFFDN